METEEIERPRPGRPRSETARQAILAATLELLQTTSVRAITIDAIARQANVGKPTIYRWWSTKVALVLEAFMTSMLPHTPIRRNVPAAEALRNHMRLLARQYAGIHGRVVAEVIGESQSEPEILKAFHEQFFSHRREAVRALIEQGKAAGEFDATTDTETALDMLYGPIYFRLLVKHAPLDAKFVDQVAVRVLAVLGTRVK
jgi:AcrR family transcriptional regulator